MTEHSNAILNTTAAPDNAKNTLPVHIYLGGSFDPVHISHIMMLSHVYQTIQKVVKTDNAAHVKASFMPTSRSPLKQNTTSPEHRLAMLKLVTDLSDSALDSLNVEDSPYLKTATNFDICEHELWQEPPTYSIDTLRFLEDSHPNHSIVFVVGADNIASLSKWRDGDKLTEYAHIWILPRDEFQSPHDIKMLLPDSLQTKVTQHPEALAQTPYGKIFIDNHSVKAISSSEIRHAIAKEDTTFAKSALPRPVYSYIMTHNLYQKP